MKNKKIVIFWIVIINITAFTITFEKTYSKYILTKHLETTFSSQPFYFEANFNMPIEMVDGTATLITYIRNYVENNYNTFDTIYEITMEENSKLKLGTTNITGTIAGNKKEQKNVDVIIEAKPNIKLGLQETATIKVVSTKPYNKEIKIPITINRINRPPEIISEFKLTAHTPNTLTFTGTVMDLDDDDLIISITGFPTNPIIQEQVSTKNGKVITFTINNLDNYASYSGTVKITDTYEASVSSMISARTQCEGAWCVHCARCRICSYCYRYGKTITFFY